MLLENKTAGVIVFGLKKSGSQPIPAMPGVNSISENVWKELSKNKSIVHMLEDEKLVVVAVKTEKGKQAKVPNAEQLKEAGCHLDLYGFDPKESIKIVKKTLFLPLLNEWLDEETRPKVQRALQEQKDVVGPTKVKKD